MGSPDGEIREWERRRDGETERRRDEVGCGSELGASVGGVKC
jgi:hypothetical protein